MNDDCKINGYTEQFRKVFRDSFGVGDCDHEKRASIVTHNLKDFTASSEY